MAVTHKTKAGTTATDDAQTARRIKYGLNVAVAIVASLAIVVVFNLITVKYLKRIRLDVTESRRYSLSEQTHKLLRGLEHDYSIISLMSTGIAEYDNARDLIDEYGHYSGSVTVEHLNPASEQADRFFKAIAERYDSHLEPIRTAIERAHRVLVEIEPTVSQQVNNVRDLSKTAGASNPRLSELIAGVDQFFQQWLFDCSPLIEKIPAQLQDPIADLGRISAALAKAMTELDGGLSQMTARYRPFVDADDISSAIKDKLLSLTTMCKQLRSSIAATIDALNNLPDAADYEKLRNQLDQQDSVAIVGEDEVQVIAVSDMFPQPNASELRRAQEEGRTLNPTFLGEEKITGALISMELDRKPMIVFVSDDPRRPALGPRGTYRHVAQRLENMNFEVRPWLPTANRGPDGRMAPPQPPPQPANGQRVVWVITPLSGSSAMFGGPASGGAAQKVADVVREQLGKGQAALINFAPDRSAGLGGSNPMVELVGQWDITPQVDRLLLREIMFRGRSLGINEFKVIDWPNHLSVTEALGRMPGVFAFASPLVLGATEGKNLEHWILAEVRGDRVWAETDYGPDPYENLFDETKAAAAFTLAVAAQRDAARLIVVTDAVWASDDVTAAGSLQMQGGRVVIGTRYPANAELFVNSVCWLAGLEQIIARTARSQDIRRINDISATSLTVIRWWLPTAMVLTTFFAGMTVWLVRRSS